MIFPVIARRLENKDLYTVSVHQGLDLHADVQLNPPTEIYYQARRCSRANI
jgi:hypothetical protein